MLIRLMDFETKLSSLIGEERVVNMVPSDEIIRALELELEGMRDIQNREDHGLTDEDE